MADQPLWQLSASRIAALVRSGDLSAEEVARATVARMRATNPALNAVVEDLGDSAVDAARAIDQARARGQTLGPLAGVPVTIKVNVDQKGHATTNGVPAYRDVIAPDDAPVPANLKRAGAIVVGRTNTPEFSFRAETDNPLHGRTRNPWGDHVSPGGSSGGAGSAVMAGMCAIAHGNDIGGSLRFPAAAAGAVTVKPGLGRVPAWNPSQKAERGMLAQSMSVQGLIARTTADLALAMPALIAPDPRDPFHVPLPWAGPRLDGPIRVAFTRDGAGFDMHPDVEAALLAASDALTDAGYQVVETAVPLIRESATDGFRALMGEVKALMGPDIDTKGSDTLKAIFAEYYRQFPPFEGTNLLLAMARRSHYARAWSLFLQDYPLVLTPFQQQPFYRPLRDTEGADGVREVLGSALYSFSMNFMGLPAGCVPARLARLPQGEQPIGVQIVGRRWREDLIVDAMAAVEARVGMMADQLFQRG